MDLTLSEEQKALHDLVGSFVEQSMLGAHGLRGSEVTADFDRDSWRALARDLGVLGLNVPEELGGSGSSLLEPALVCEKLGYALYSGPYLATTMASTALCTAVDQRHIHEYLAKLTNGAETWSMATAQEIRFIAGPPEFGRPTDVDVSGEVNNVLHGASVDWILLLVQSAQGVPEGILVLPGDASGVRSRPSEKPLDLLRPQHDIHLDHVQTTHLPAKKNAADPERALDRCRILLAAELLGLGQKCLDMSVAYSTDREQFGRPIGSFQAIQHRCADLLVDLEHARSATYVAAARAHEADFPTSAVDALLAFTSSARAAVAATRACVQIHGGLGFTWEHEAHWYVRRAMSDRVLLGTPSEHLDRLFEVGRVPRGEADNHTGG